MAETERIVLAGGCFWGMQDLIRKLPGVMATRVGYAGGTLANPGYKDVRTGTTGHAESIEITFDPGALPLRRLLGFFFRMHDPTTLDRQGNDRGSQYRSAIFPQSEAQATIAREVVAAVDASGQWPGKVVTRIEPAGTFWPAEDYHQDYLVHNPGGYTCHWVRPDWVLVDDEQPASAT